MRITLVLLGAVSLAFSALGKRSSHGWHSPDLEQLC